MRETSICFAHSWTLVYALQAILKCKVVLFVCRLIRWGCLYNIFLFAEILYDLVHMWEKRHKKVGDLFRFSWYFGEKNVSLLLS